MGRGTGRSGFGVYNNIVRIAAADARLRTSKGGEFRITAARRGDAKNATETKNLPGLMAACVSCVCRASTTGGGGGSGAVF